MSSKVLNLNTPPIDIESDDMAWDRAEEFRFAIDAFFYEVAQYVTERKWALKQAEITFDNEDDPFANTDAPSDAVPITSEDDSQTSHTGQVA